MSSRVPARIPACAQRLLARPEWFDDPGVVSRARLTQTRGFARFISSERFAGTKTDAITLGHTIHIHDIENYNPHTVKGLTLLAHELKHVEQYEREGLLRFIARYLRAYLWGGYGESVPFEAEAYQFQRAVKIHLEDEFAANAGRDPCQEMDEPHTPQEAFAKAVPQEFQFAV